MIFNSFQFIWLFPSIFVAYWLCYRFTGKGHSLAKYLLLAISYGVYMQWNAAFALVLLYVTAVTYAFGLLFAHPVKRKTCCLWGSIMLTIVPLLLFKYFNFITQAGASVLAWVGIDTPAPSLSWVIPLGLSFYTFQALGYMVDVYKERINAERKWWDYMLYVSFFPQILCGPISKASELLPQIKDPAPFKYTQAVSGLRMVLWGMFLKVVLADRVGMYTDVIYQNPEIYSGVSCFIASVFYSLQIFGDFAGYSYMAVGVARLLGINLIVNFHRPYFAQSIADFWKRWHISLTRWLTTYIYIPLGGSRCSKARNNLNIMLTFLVSGIWHGANYTFILWGAIHGFFQVVEKTLGLNKLNSKGILRFIRIIVTFLIVNTAWIFFRAPSIGDAFDIISRLFSSGGVLYLDLINFIYSFYAIAIVVAIEAWMEFGRKSFKAFLYKSVVIRWSAYCVLTLSILALGVMDASQFIYVQF